MKQVSFVVLGLGMAVAVTWHVQGCGPLFCTEAGCFDRLNVRLEPALGPGEAYEFEFRENDGERILCKTSIPLPKGNSIPCTVGDGDVPAYHLLHAVESENGEVERIDFHHAPRSLEIVIRREGVELGRKTFRPSYEKYYPNGEECDADWGGCDHADVDMKL
jgi:hypothetical protein